MIPSFALVDKNLGFRLLVFRAVLSQKKSPSRIPSASNFHSEDQNQVVFTSFISTFSKIVLSELWKNESITKEFCKNCAMFITELAHVSFNWAYVKPPAKRH